MVKEKRRKKATKKAKGRTVMRNEGFPCLVTSRETRLGRWLYNLIGKDMTTLFACFVPAL